MQKMYVCWLFSFAFFCLSASCSRHVENKFSMVIQAPQGKVGSLAAIPADRKQCYLAIITGDGISGTGATTCHPASGILAGYVASGQNIEAMVPSGANRTVDLYLYLKNSGDNSACPPVGNRIAPGLLKSIYFVGQATNVSTAEAENSVTIVATFPGVGQNLLVQNSYPNSCVPQGIVGLPGFSMPTASGEAVGSGHILRGKVGRAVGGNVHSGTNHNIRVIGN